jgi:hypothetical protein
MIEGVAPSFKDGAAANHARALSRVSFVMAIPLDL